MTIEVLQERGLSNRAIARALGVDEKTVRYRRERLRRRRPDGRSRQASQADALAEVIRCWVERTRERGLNLAALYEHLVAEHCYPGSYKSIQRYVRAHHPRPKRRARRRVETPPGAQGQVDWAEFRGIWIGGRRQDLYAFHLELSHSRREAVVWSPRKTQLAWLHAHNESFRRLDGVPAVLRVDNEKTAISRGAGAWGEINPTYRRYARTVRFHIDACPPRSPQAKGKVERRIRDQRASADPRARHWRSPDELQEWTDEQLDRSARQRTCPATGTTVWEAWHEEKHALAPVPLLPEPFDCVVTRPVGIDCLVAFEGRRYSVPFRFVGQRVEVRGCAGQVQVLSGADVVAVHPRGTQRRIVLDPEHFEGPPTDTVLPPTPLGRMGRRLEELRRLEPARRPLDLYAALAEVAR